MRRRARSTELVPSLLLFSFPVSSYCLTSDLRHPPTPAHRFQTLPPVQPLSPLLSTAQTFNRSQCFTPDFAFEQTKRSVLQLLRSPRLPGDRQALAQPRSGNRLLQRPRRRCQAPLRKTEDSALSHRSKIPQELLRKSVQHSAASPSSTASVAILEARTAPMVKQKRYMALHMETWKFRMCQLALALVVKYSPWPSRSTVLRKCPTISPLPRIQRAIWSSNRSTLGPQTF